jgi:hypothetical protein
VKEPTQNPTHLYGCCHRTRCGTVVNEHCGRTHFTGTSEHQEQQWYTRWLGENHTEHPSVYQSYIVYLGAFVPAHIPTLILSGVGAIAIAVIEDTHLSDPPDTERTPR